jgi:hypothetical protein
MAVRIWLASIDWAATGTMIQGLGTVAGVGAVVWAAGEGRSTFDEWRTQKITERKQTQAERILTATYKAQRALVAVRSPMMWQHELNAAEASISENDWWKSKTSTHQKRLTEAQAYHNRLNHTKDNQLELDQCLPMARALFGEELEQAIKELHRQFWNLRVDAEFYGDDEDRRNTAFSDKIERALRDAPSLEGEINEVSDTIAKSVATIERICLPVLRDDTINRSRRKSCKWPVINQTP